MVGCGSLKMGVGVFHCKGCNTHTHSHTLIIYLFKHISLLKTTAAILRVCSTCSKTYQTQWKHSQSVLVRFFPEKKWEKCSRFTETELRHFVSSNDKKASDKYLNGTFFCSSNDNGWTRVLLTCSEKTIIWRKPRLGWGRGVDGGYKDRIENSDRQQPSTVHKNWTRIGLNVETVKILVQSGHNTLLFLQQSLFSMTLTVDTEPQNGETS